MVKRLLLVAFWLAFALGALWFLSRGEHPADVDTRPGSGTDLPVRPEEAFEPANALEHIPGLPDSAGAFDRNHPTEPDEPAPPAHAALGITVLDPELQPSAGVDVLVLDAARGIQTGKTDLAGRAEFAPHAGEGVVFLRPPNAQPRREFCDFSAGERRIVLLAGDELAGWVTVDGAAPGESIPLTLESDQALFDVAEVPRQVREFLKLQSGRGVFTASGATEAKGRFLFRGLDPAWSGALVVGREYTLRDPGIGEAELRRVRIPAPTRTLQVELSRLPRLTGRVVDERGEPAPEQGLAVSCQVWRPSGMLVAQAATLDGGRFSLAVEPDYEAVEFHVLSPEGTASVRRTRAEIGEDLDVGDIALVPGPPETDASFTVRVQDPSGTPIGGASGRVQSDPRRVTRDADDQGEIRWQGLPEGETVLVVRADGFWPESRAVSLPRADPLAVALTPCNRLTVTTLDAAGQPATGVELQVSIGAETLFANDDDHPGSGARFSGIGTVLRDDDGRTWRQFRAVEPGRFVLQRLPPTAQLGLRVVDPFRNELVTRLFAPLAADEQREVALSLGGELHALVVTVRDEAGAALVGAEVRVEDRRGATRPAYGATQTDARGRREVEGIGCASVFVAVERAGLASEPPREVQLVGPRTEVEIVLRVGRSVAVLVLDSSGGPVDLTGEYGDVFLGAAQPAGETAWWAKRAGPGKFEFEALPREAVVLTLTLAGATYAADLAADASSARFEVPMHGRIEASLALPAPADGTWYVLQLARRGSSDVLMKRTLNDARTDFAVFPAVLAGEYTLTLTRGGFGVAETVLGEPQLVLVEPGAVATASLRVP